MSELDLASRALTARNLEDFATCPLKLMFSITASREELEKLLGGIDLRSGRRRRRYRRVG